MLPMLLMGLGGSVLGAKEAQDQRKEARRQGDFSALMGSGQTAYSGLTGAGPGKIDVAQGGPSVLGSALSGGVAGAAQGQAFSQAMAQDKLRNAYAKMLEDQQVQSNAMVGGAGEAPVIGVGPSVISGSPSAYSRIKIGQRS